MAMKSGASGRRVSKSIEEATSVRHKILYAFEVAEADQRSGTAKSWLTFSIVGPVADLGSEARRRRLQRSRRQTLRNDFRSIHPEDAQSFSMDGAPRI
jgi:NADH dehydrogenase